ncbi:MAG: zinc dependent phospholipase C family protein [Bacteroidota bacterium]|nr:zinc dependent phospholipase C family protein [Bacteroidota bacterium]
MNLKFHLKLGLFLFAIWMVCSSWGFWAHKRINYYAVKALPIEIKGFFDKYSDFLVEHSVDPDKRRFCYKEEGVRHYIDLDMYGSFPYADLPHDWRKAKEKYSEDTVRSRGIVPWVISWEYKKLVKAFADKDADRILDISADLGHYIADAHVPLHTTENYDGQLTDQVGIHALWESIIPEYFAPNYDFTKFRQVKLIKDPLAKAWEIVFHSHKLLDSSLRIERELFAQYGTTGKYCWDKKQTKEIRHYQSEYLVKYNTMLRDMAYRQIRLSIEDLADFWYSAWVEAGQPNLSNLLMTKDRIAEYGDSEED